jgi:uncharacterized protein YxjI
MDKAEIERKIVNLEKEGFKETEIREAMSKEGYSNQIIQEVFTDLKNRRNQQKTQNNRQQPKKQQPVQKQNNRQRTGSSTIPGIDLTENYYKIRQRLIRNKYKVYDFDDNIVLRAKQKLFRLKENFKFKDEDGEMVFEVQAKQIMDIAGDYTLVDPETEEPITVLEKNWTLLTHKWKIKDASNDERLLAHFHTENKGRAFVRFIGSEIPMPFIGLVLSWIPHKYLIESPEGEDLGHMTGKLSVRDIYELELENMNPDLKEAVVASAIAIDAIEGN